MRPPEDFTPPRWVPVTGLLLRLALLAFSLITPRS